MITEWQIRRSKFNHDWLKIEYINSLGGIIDMLQYNMIETRHLQRFLTEKWGQWETKRLEANWLIDSFEKNMSPAILLEVEPLNRMAAHNRVWLKELVHFLWLARWLINEKVSLLRHSFSVVSQQFEEIDKRIKEHNGDTGYLRELLPEIKVFREACLEFSKCISALPSEVMVV